MNREKRLVGLTLLTLVAYASLLFFEKGIFLIPFPLHEFIFFIVCIQFAFWNYKKDPINWTLVLLVGFLKLLSTQFFWSILVPDALMQNLTNGPILDTFRLFYYGTIIIWASFFLFAKKSKFNTLIWLGFVSMFLSSIIFESTLLETISYTGIALYGIIKRIQVPINLLWVLLASLAILKYITLHL